MRLVIRNRWSGDPTDRLLNAGSIVIVFGVAIGVWLAVDLNGFEAAVMGTVFLVVLVRALGRLLNVSTVAVANDFIRLQEGPLVWRRRIDVPLGSVARFAARRSIIGDTFEVPCGGKIRGDFEIWLEKKDGAQVRLLRHVSDRQQVLDYLATLDRELRASTRSS